MAYSERQADRIRTRLAQLPVSEKKMMGGLIFMVNNAMCLGLDTDKQSQTDRLMVRVGTLNYEALLSEPGSRIMNFTGTVMRGFLFIDADAFDFDKDLDFWVEKALEFNQMLTQSNT
jgi:TfoX/Sxy family transcriptional regulator of competence genes